MNPGTNTLSRPVRYIIAGGTSAAVNLIVTWVLERAGLYYLAVVTVAFAVALVVSFTLQKFFTFRNREPAVAHRQFVIFTVIGVINLLVNDVLVYMQVQLFHLGPAAIGRDYLVFAQAVASVIIAAYSFFVYRILFKEKGDEGETGTAIKA